MIGPIEGDTVPFQFCQALCRDHLRKGVEAFHIISKLIEDLRVILLYRRAEPTQISNDAGILILLQILKHLDHGRLVLILKYLFPNAQQICNCGRDAVYIITLINILHFSVLSALFGRLSFFL